MGKVLISSDQMTGIADAVRHKLGGTEKLTTSEITQQILSMSNGLSLDVIADGYSSAKTYAIGDLVTYQDKLYACTTAILTSENFDATHWRETTICDELSTILKAGVADDKYY